MKIYGIQYQDRIIYIGQTIQSGKKRYYDHWRVAEKDERTDKLHTFLKEHINEKNFFEFIILEDNIEDKNKLNELESFYIEKYDTYNNGFNSYKQSNTINLNPYSKKVNWFDNEKRYIKTFNSIVEAERETGVNVSNISHCCNHIQTKTSKGWFRFCGDESPLEDSYRPGVSLSVEKLDPFTLEVIAEYPSLQIAEQENHITSGYLSFVCSGKKYSAKGFLYRYKDKSLRTEFPNDKTKRVGIAQVGPNKIVINKFLSVKDAAKTTGLNEQTISRAKNNPNRLSLGYYWIRSDQYSELLKKGEIIENEYTRKRY